VPLHTFVVGKDTSTGEAKDVVVTGVECNPSPAFIKADVTVTAKVNAYNFAGAKVTAQVFFNDETGEERQSSRSTARRGTS
jgi:hypothetical protein